jgi:hypothetical protein
MMKKKKGRKEQYACTVVECDENEKPAGWFCKRMENARFQTRVRGHEVN